jgi:hypothetical protein
MLTHMPVHQLVQMGLRLTPRGAKIAPRGEDETRILRSLLGSGERMFSGAGF